MDASGAREERRVSADTRAAVAYLPEAERLRVELLSCLNEYAISSANETRLLVDGGDFFAALGRRIDDAQHHVHGEFYIGQRMRAPTPCSIGSSRRPAAEGFRGFAAFPEGFPYPPAFRLRPSLRFETQLGS